MNRITFDATLLADIIINTGNSNGMMRVADELMNEFVKDNLDFDIANFIFLRKYHHLSQQYLALKEIHDIPEKIITKIPPNIPGFLENDRRYYKLINKYLKISNRLKNPKQVKHFHSFYNPFNKEILKLNCVKSITFLDIIPLVYEGYGPYKAITQKVVDSIKNNFAISISEFSKNDLLNYDTSIKEENVFVVPLAANKKIFYRNNNEDEWVKVKKKYDLPDKYFLTLSSSDVRKNIEHTILGFSQYCNETKDKEVKLVVAGNFNNTKNIISKLGLSNEVRSRIVTPQIFIDNKDLAAVYSKAICFIFLSLYEGFGLPVLEAMQCGTPVITSNTTSLPEVAKDSGILISPTSKDDLCKSLTQIRNDATAYEQYSLKSIERAALFSWEETAKKYIEIFKIIQNV